MAVIALALSPVWGVQTVDAASSLAPARAPYYPSFDSTGCAAVTGDFGGVVISCGTGAYLTTQITSAYGGCSEIDISVAAWGSGPFIAVATAPVGGLTSTVTLTEAGDYYMRLSWVPTTTIGPIQIQFSAPNTGNMSLENITVNPCPVPPTNTPVPPTNTPNPSDTATTVPPTATSGPSHTPTPIPTNTPLPSGHSTFTPTATATGLATSTRTATPGITYRNCGDANFPVVNCGWIGGANTTNPTFWTDGDLATGHYRCWDEEGVQGNGFIWNQLKGPAFACYQTVTAHQTGNIIVVFQYTQVVDSAFPFWQFDGIGTTTWPPIGSCNTGTANFCTSTIHGVTSGETGTFGPGIVKSIDGNFQYYVNLDHVYMTTSSGTVVPTNSPTTTNTPVPGTSTPTTTPTLTPLPIPGAMSTPIPTSTECPGGCAVAKLTAIPGMATITTVDTSPFSPLLHLSLARSGCAPFGFALIPVPHIIGTPALGSTVPLSYTWTVPLTANWDDNHPFSNTAIQPCAMVKEIPTFVWDLTYWLSVLMLAVGYTIWLIGLVGRLSGEETING